MLAYDIADHFEEWLAEQNFAPQTPRSWSLDKAILAWLKDEAVYWTNESYELYLRTVVIILANWITYREHFTYQLDGKEEVIEELYDEQYVSMLESPPWESLQRDRYDKAVFTWREEHVWNKPLPRS